ncbi:MULTISPECIES: phage major capsid protein [Haloarcula]|uniref:phage major capsid protein n=1 Tax=Haloarcula TaxID=2237 RepID=UPI000F8CDDCE|nr:MULTISPECIES: phage major capsid protein [Haloarcula]NHX41390.1 phage major capsid protein [Haloarcula sp. R1-2]
MSNDGNVNSSEVIDQEAVRAEIEGVAEENLVYRRAFRSIDSTNYDSNTVEIPVNQDTTASAGIVPEGGSYPSSDEQFEKVTISHDKYGAEVEITYEAIQDSKFDVVTLQTEDEGRDLAEALDSAAEDEILLDDDGDGNFDNLQDAVVGDAGGSMDYATAIDAMAALEDLSYDPDLLIVSAQSKADLMKSDKFTHATELGDETVRDGAFGQIAGIDVYVGDGGSLGAGEALMFDTDRYGIESVREDFTSVQYEKESENKRVVQVRTRMGWKCIRPEAGVKIEA